LFSSTTGESVGRASSSSPERNLLAKLRTDTSRFGLFRKALGRVGAKAAGKAVERLVPATRIYPTFIDATSAE